MDSLAAELAQELKDFAWNAAWCSANEAKWMAQDAARNREAAERHFQAAVETRGLSAIVMSDVKKMVWAAAKHATLERLSILQASQSEEAKHEFQHTADFVKLSGEMSEGCAAHLRWMAWNAAWHAANVRAGNEADARRDRGRFEQHSRALRGGLLRGVNLGGWLLLERWMNTKVFADFSESEAPDEVSLCERLEARTPGAAAARITEWRQKWITKLDFQMIKEMGFNSVRIPFGWWCVDGIESLGLSRGALVGPAMSLLDQAVAWASETGLKVILDLHSAPGFQSGHQATGKSDAAWKWQNWNIPATVAILGLVAKRYSGSSAVAAFCVINEPSNQVPASVLCGFYRDAAAAIRGAGMLAGKVTLLFPAYQRSLQELKDQNFPGGLQDAVLDIHLYQCFDQPWSWLGAEEHLARASDGKCHWPGLPECQDLGVEAAITEWSLRLPDWDEAFPFRAEWLAYSQAEKDHVIAEFARRQVAQFKKASIWTFWCWKVDADGEHFWSAKECVARGWLWPGDFF